jgi:hypothetical protein
MRFDKKEFAFFCILHMWGAIVLHKHIVQAHSTTKGELVKLNFASVNMVNMDRVKMYA